MSADQVLEQARALGVVLSDVAGKQHYEAPAGSLTPELRESLAAHKTAILVILETERLAARRIMKCRDCEYYIPSSPVHRASGAVWEMPGGCEQGRTSPDSRPPIYPCTEWTCDGWTTRRLQ